MPFSAAPLRTSAAAGSDWLAASDNCSSLEFPQAEISSAAVMTTEQGARAVATGVEQCNAAGEAFRQLSERIADAAQAAVQIAASSQQQLAGMDQVAMAMENIKEVSAENAAGSRQAEVSARNLNELGQKLRQISERFTL